MLIYLNGFLAGLISGILGYGSGFVMVMLMLYLNVNARVATATSAYNYFWLALNNLFSLISNHSLPLDMVLWFSFLAVI